MIQITNRHVLTGSSLLAQINYDASFNCSVDQVWCL